MNGSILVALVTIAGALAAARPVPLAAQATAPPQRLSYPLEMTGAPGVSIEIFLNAGKVADAMLDSNGGASAILDLANVGKTTVNIYVDVCKDGKIVQVMFVTGGGQAPPEGESCRRRLAAVSFQSDCGVTRINLDFRNFAARIVGCAAFYTRPQFYGPVGGAAVLLPFLLGGDDDGPATFVSTPVVPQQPTVVTPPVAPPTNTTSPAPPTAPAAPTAAGNYTCVAVVIVADNGRHNPFINLGPGLTGVFVVSIGSITIRHPAPFVEIVNAQYDTASGRFSGDGRGTVAGFPNVSVRAEGTVNVNTGRIEFNYTMGAGGELPGGQPITYRITLQKQ